MTGPGLLITTLAITPRTGAQLVVGVNATLNRTALPNAADTTGGPITLDYKPTYRLAGGVDLGYRFETGFGLSGLFLGLDYTPVARNYHFAYDPSAIALPQAFDYENDFTTSLRYLRGTVSTEFTLAGADGGFRLTVSPGFYVGRLLSYHDGERPDGKWREGTENQTFFLAIPIFDTTLVTRELLGPAYSKWDYGPRLVIGAELPFTETIALTASIHGTYGMSNAESQDAQLAFVPSPSNGGITAAPQAWYYREGRFILPINGTQVEDKRTVPTHTFTAGASLGLRITF